jgi:3-hydroxyacyl-[acyl-carrier-protein] dehydratase
MGKLKKLSDDLKKDNYNIQDIIKILPHRYPFILIDRIDEVKPGEYVNAIKNVTINEPYFQGHFPGQPVMPGVLSLESIAQTTAFLMLYELDDPLKKNMFISGVDGVRFRRLIVPGDQLHINIRLKSKKLTLYKFEGTIKIDGKLAVQAIITSNLVDRVEV